MSSSNSTMTVPNSVTVPANAISARFRDPVASVVTLQAATVTGSGGSICKNFTLLNAVILALSISATNMAFGDLVVNTSATQPVTLTSNGILPVTVNGATLTGAGFTLPGAALPATLSPSQTATPNVEFDLMAGEAATSQLTIPSISSANGAAVVSMSSNSIVAQIPPRSAFTPPAANACQSRYDQFYEAEPGVYAYWALCEPGSPIQIYDYVGQFDLTPANQSWSTGTVSGGSAGPVPDAETAASVPTASFHIEGQGIPLNTNQGTVAAWINSDATSHPVTAVFLGAVSGNSNVSIVVNLGSGICFNGSYVNATATAFTTRKCGYAANTWHRVVISWSGGSLSLYVDGAPVGDGTYTGALDNTVFYYRLFPGCCDTGKQMTLAKVSISNQAWNSSQVMADFTPSFPPIPPGGVYVSSQILGTVHRDVLGYGDQNQNISTLGLQAALLSGLAAGGFTSVRVAGGYGGIQADLENWQGGVTCTNTPGVMAPAQNVSNGDNLDHYFRSIAKPLGLDAVFTVNYGTNPPLCDAGADPMANGADLVRYANVVNKYGIKYWEIGNEVASTTTESDFHPNPHTGASYVTYEPTFYTLMKAVDPTIKIAVPIGLAIYAWQSGFDLPVLAGASFDAVVWHNYPMTDPITDGDTLYQDRVSSSLRRTRAALLKLQTELLNNGKSADAIWITEWNGELSGNKWSKQTMGAVTPLFVASQLAEYMQAGVQLATWWTQGAPNGCSTFNYDANGETAYSWWECGGTGLVYAGPTVGAAEVPIGIQPGDLTPAARGFQVLSQSGFASEGEHMLRTQTDVQNAPWLLSYAATHGSSYAIILINRDRDLAHTVPVTIAGKTSGGSAQQWIYGRAQYDSSQTGNWSVGPVLSTCDAWSGSFQATLPPWSVNVVILGK